MDAYEISDFILSVIKKSNLNFSLSESPFSVSIDIKKTFITNKDGSTRSSNIPKNSSFSFDTQKVHQNCYANESYHSQIHAQEPIVPIPLPMNARAANPKFQDLTHHQVSQPDPHHIQTQAGVLHHHQDTENNRHSGLVLPPHHANNHPLHHDNKHPHHKTHEDVNLHTIEPFLHHVHDVPPLPRNLKTPLQTAQLEIPHQDLVFPRQQDFVPNIPVKNRFSCLVNIANGDFTNIRDSIEIPSNSYTSELNNIVEQDEVEYLVVNNRRLKEVTKRLNTELARVKTEVKKDKNDAVKDLKVEIKQWRKSLGLERSPERVH